MTGLNEKTGFPFAIDGVEYDPSEIVISSIKRSFSVADGDNAGRNIAGGMIRDIVGTYFNYTIDFNSKSSNPAVYETLFETLAAPADYHTLSLPFGDKTIVQKMYVTGGEDSLKKFKRSGENIFGDLSVNFIAMKPFLIP